jgi:Kdo2-lipid IVA lauroyltransferase/acyltransferase
LLTTHTARYRLEELAARIALALFGVLPVDAASAVGGWLGRSFGPLLSAHRIAERNLRRAFPQMNDSEVARTLRAMWDNLGRVAAEYAHLTTIANDPTRVEIIDPGGIAAALRDDGIGCLMVSAHYGNWELASTPGCRAGLNQVSFYRAPNNPFVSALVRRLRQQLSPGGFLPKSAEGARQALAMLKQGAHIAMLVDQKQNEGIAVPFFGRDAMTTPAPAAFAQRMRLPIAAGKVERRGGAYFRITAYRVEPADTGDRRADVAETTRRINALFEGWIRERPDLWFWVHRRWPD